jgi:hypothetical protein
MPDIYSLIDGWTRYKAWELRSIASIYFIIQVGTTLEEIDYEYC